MQLITEPKTKSEVRENFFQRQTLLVRFIVICFSLFFIPFQCVWTCAPPCVCAVVPNAFPTHWLSPYYQQRTSRNDVFLYCTTARTHRSPFRVCIYGPHWNTRMALKQTQNAICLLMPYVRCSRVYRTLSSYSLRVPFRTQIMQSRSHPALIYCFEKKKGKKFKTITIIRRKRIHLTNENRKVNIRLKRCAESWRICFYFCFAHLLHVNSWLPPLECSKSCDCPVPM